MWLGVSIHSGDRKFYVPENYPLEAAGCGIDEDGKRFIRVKGVRWFTNLEHHRRNEKMTLWRRYYDDPSMYPKYDNYDAIEVSKTSDIPCDYWPSDFALDKSNNYNGAEQSRARANERSYGSPNHIPRQVQPRTIRDTLNR